MKIELEKDEIEKYLMSVLAPLMLPGYSIVDVEMTYSGTCIVNAEKSVSQEGDE